MRRALLAAFSAWFYGMALLCTVLALGLLGSFLLLASLVVSRRAALRLLRYAILWYGRMICALAFPVVRVRFQDEAPGQRIEGSIVVCNHRAASDAFLISSLWGEAVQVVNIWPMRLPVIGYFARRAEYLSVREMPASEFLERAGSLLAKRVAVYAFPEGTRSGGKAMGQFHSIMFRLALESRVPIVPLAIAGNEKAPPRGDWVLQPSLVRIRKLQALLPQDYQALDAFRLKNLVKERLGVRLAELDAR